MALEGRILLYYLKVFSIVSILFFILVLSYSFYILNKKNFQLNKTLIVSKNESLDSILNKNLNDFSKIDISLVKLFYKLNKLFTHFKSIKIQKNQIVDNKILDIDNKLLAEINSELGSELNVSPIDLSKYDTEAIKSLFMNGCLFRVSKNMVISEDQKNQLLDIVDSLPNNFSVTDFKEQSSLTRKYAIPYLEFLDKELVTKKIDSSGLRTKIN